MGLNMAALADFRKLAGLTQGELADLAGLTQGAITHLESGRTRSPEIATLRKIAAALAAKGIVCSVDDIFPPEPDQEQAA